MTLPQNIDQEQVLAALMEAEIGPAAREEASRLVEHVIERMPGLPESKWSVVSVETQFFIQLAPKWFCIGVGDAHFRDEHGLIHAEWKTKGAPKLTKAGEPYKGQDEDSWLDDISNDVQVAIYALAGHEGTFIDSNDSQVRFRSFEPRVMVRACVKSTPPQIWPHDYRKGLYTFPLQALNATRNALLVKCQQIDAARKSGLIPWTLIGEQCENKYRNVCEFREEVCKKHLNPPSLRWGNTKLEDMVEGRRKWYETLKMDPNDPEVILLSPHKYTDYTRCMERGRMRYEVGTVDTELQQSFEQEVGTGYHAALASIYRQWTSK